MEVALLKQIRPNGYFTEILKGPPILLFYVPNLSSNCRIWGTGFRHPRCVPPQCDLRLRDLYVYPDLMHRRLDKVLPKDGGAIAIIPGDGFVPFLKTHQNVLIFGADDCGKT